MTLSIITPQKTTNYEDIKGMMIPTPNGTKQLQINNGTVELMQKGKATFFLKPKDGWEPQKIELFVQDGIVYVEHSIINLVTPEVN
jgi:F0F1-type ATP synthase epsilon subunit